MPLTRRSGRPPLPAPPHQPRIRRSPCCHSWAASQLLQGSSFLSVVMSVSPSFPGAFLSSGRRWESSGFALPRLPRLSCSCSRGLRSLQHSSWAPKCSCERPASAGSPFPALSTVHVWPGLLFLLFIGHRRKHRLLLGFLVAAWARAQGPSLTLCLQ